MLYLPDSTSASRGFELVNLGAAKLNSYAEWKSSACFNRMDSKLKKKMFRRVWMCLWRIQTNFVYRLARLLRTARLLQDKLKADELAKDKIEAKKVPHFEDHVPPHIIQPKVFVTIQLCADVLTIAVRDAAIVAYTY
ncbi:hypothetical protein Tco_0886190 [Tanacetum coccineum]